MEKSPKLEFSLANIAAFVAALFVALRPFPTGAAAAVQDSAHFAKAIRGNSSSPYFVRVTIIDDRTGQARTGCTEAPLLLGAIHIETDLPYDRLSSDRVAQVALSNTDHVFHFSNQQALDNMPFNHSDPACALIERGFSARMADITGEIYPEP